MSSSLSFSPFSARSSSSSSSRSSSGKNDRDVVIVTAVRTPLCKAKKGGLANISVSTLLETVLTGVLEISSASSNLKASDIQDVCVGNVLLPANGFATIRVTQLLSGFDETSSLQLVNRQCASGLQAMATIANSIKAGEIDIGVAAGVESMSQTSMTSIGAPKQGSMIENYQSLPQSALDCLLPMGVTSDTLAREFQLERHILDQFAVRSHQKAAAAQQAGNFDSEILPIGTITRDDGIRPESTLETLSQLRPLFSLTGSTTAANASQMTDGAAAVLMMTRQQARQRNLPILGKWVGYAVAGVPPRLMGMGPAVAIPAVLQQTGLTLNDIDVLEINEAFASQAYWSCRELGFSEEEILHGTKVNPNGGAIALGHPLGCTGARMVATLLPELRRRPGARYGVVSMCIGTGMGAAAVIEVEPPNSKL